MNKFKFIIILSATALALLSCAGCAKNKKLSGQSVSIIVAETTEEITTEPPVVETFPEIPVTYPNIEKKDTGTLYEAENAVFKGSLSVSYSKDNYSGEGYVSGFIEGGKSSVTFNINAPSNQHYDISFNIASESEALCSVSLNGRKLTEFKTDSSGKFTQVTIRGVFLVKGLSSIEIIPDGKNVCIDYLKLINNTTLKDGGYNAESELSNKNSADAAKELMSFLTENYGKYIITGQYAADADNSELDLIYRTTGKYPVIRFTNLTVPRGSFDESFKTINAAADWYRNGGISCVSWYWNSPSEKSSIKTEECDFSLKNAVTDKEIAMLSQEDIRSLYAEGDISGECYSLILDIDNIAGQLTSLKNKGVPVLWRPLPEGSGDWYWWGADGSEAYKWLWNLLYTRLTNYFELDNLIWIWNGQSKDFLVDKSTFDIAALDLYVEGEKDYGGRFYEKFAATRKFLDSNKLIAISECGSVPDIDGAFRDNAVWSFFGLWFGNYIETENGELSEEFTSREALIHAYNSNGSLTLDEYRDLRGWKKPEAAPEKNNSEASSEEE